jgi:hypothetical protein
MRMRNVIMRHPESVVANLLDRQSAFESGIGKALVGILLNENSYPFDYWLEIDHRIAPLVRDRSHLCQMY